MISAAKKSVADPRWWSALPLTQRLAAGGLADVELSADERVRGEVRLRLMRENKLLAGSDISLGRWFGMGLTEPDLVTLLGESPESLRARVGEQPSWLPVVVSAWQRFGGMVATPHAHGRSHGHGHGHDHEHGEDCPHHSEEEVATDSVFLQWVRPLLTWAHNELVGRVDALAAVAGAAESLPATHSLLAPPLDRVLKMIKRVLVLELNVAREEGRLRGDTPRERFESFAQLLGDPGSALDLLAEYPVLARELVALLTNWIEVRAEFARRLLADLPLLRESFGLDCAVPTDLLDVGFGAGDSHNGGQSVGILTFAGGGKVVYKPRSLAVEVHFGELLGWLNERGLPHRLRAPKVLDRGAYGWAEFVVAQPCADTGQLDRFYWRQGAFLALLHTLRATDFHLENLVASGEHPAFVDLESMFFAPPRMSDGGSGYESEALRVIAESVLSVGLLPQRIIEFDDTGAHDLEVSGLAGGAGPDQLTPNPVVWFADAATDEMRVAKERRPILGTVNRPVLEGTAVDPREYWAQLLDGFEVTYGVLLAERDELLAEQGPLAAFGQDEVRPILRHTAYYQDLLDESWHPDVLRDGLDRDYLLETVTSGQLGLYGRESVLASELAQMSALDVPAFRTTPDSLDLYDRNGLVVSGFRQSSGMAAVRSRIAQLSQEDLEQQRWCIDASLSGLQIGEHAHQPHLVERPLPSAGLDRETALRAASEIGDRLLAAALRTDASTAAEWLSLNLIGERYWTVGPSGSGLYSGVSGIALFLAELAAVSGEARFRRAAEDVVAAVEGQVRQLAEGPVVIGGYEDFGGMLYLYSRLGQLWQDERLLDAAAALVPRVRAAMADDRYLDIIGGTAGAALAVLAVHRVRPTESTLDTLRHAGEVLRTKAVVQDNGTGWPSEVSTHRPLLGFSHGASGYAYTLASIAELTGDVTLLELAGEAVRFERHHFDPATGHWPDYRTINVDGHPMNAWCHGAAGIGLARAALLGMAPVAGRESLEHDLLAAVDRVRRDLVRDDCYTGVGNDSICHGDLGLVETLQSAGRALADPELGLLGARCAAAVADRVLAGETRSGVPFGVSTPGLMLGTAGIGYGLLRAAFGDEVPNLLLLGGTVARGTSGG